MPFYNQRLRSLPWCLLLPWQLWMVLLLRRRKYRSQISNLCRFYVKILLSSPTPIFIQFVKVNPLSVGGWIMLSVQIQLPSSSGFWLQTLPPGPSSYSSLSSSSPSSSSPSSSSSKTGPCVILDAALSRASSAARDLSTVLPRKKTALPFKLTWFDLELNIRLWI